MERNRLFTQDFSAPLDARWDYRQDDSEMEIKDGELRIKGGVPAFLMEAGNRNGVIILSVEEYVYTDCTPMDRPESALEFPMI
ncbi:MAG: hypothetical protein ACLR23_04000 [Clostridia bacterium]